MKSKGQIITGTIDGLQIYENSNFINGECIICTHSIPDTHENTRLSHWKNGVITPILRDFKVGLEDPYWLKNINGYDWLWAEKKPYNHPDNDQRNISFFRAESGTHRWRYLFDIRPEADFEKASVSSPTVKYEDGMFKMIYECRPSLARPGVNEYKVGYLEINPSNLKISSRSAKPIINDRLVPDDFGSKISGHRQDVPYESLWLSIVYKFKNGKWIKDYEPKVDGKRIEEFYFNGYYSKEQYGGMWKWENGSSNSDPEPDPEPINGDNMKPTTPTGLKLEGNTLSWNKNPESDIQSYHIYEDTLLFGKYIGSRSRYSFTFTVTGNRKYRILAENTSKKRSSPTAWVGKGAPIIEPVDPPDDNTDSKTKIKEWTALINAEVDKL